MRYEPSSSDEIKGTVAVQYGIAAGRDRKRKELEAMMAKLGAELKAAVTGGRTRLESDRPAGINQGEAEVGGEEWRPHLRWTGMLFGKEERVLSIEKKHVETSEVWVSDVK